MSLLALPSLGKPWGTGILHPLQSDSHCPLARPPKAETLHHCPQLEALKQKLKLLEEENGHLREEVRTGRGRALGQGRGEGD